MAERSRSFTATPTKEGLVKISGSLLPEVGGQLQLLLDAVSNPRVLDPVVGADLDPGSGPDSRAAATPNPASGGAAAGGPGAGEDCSPIDVSGTDTHPKARRSHAQIRHDAFASIISTAAVLPSIPDLHGAAPTPVVTMSCDDLDDPRGRARLIDSPKGDVEAESATVSTRTAQSMACDGVIDRVLTNSKGRALALETEQRIFSSHQRRVIASRDGGCIIPWCTSGPAWCEVHHVREFSAGGATATDKRVRPCWYHHRFLGSLTWSIRMRDGLAEARAPRCVGGTGEWIPLVHEFIARRTRRVS